MRRVGRGRDSIERMRRTLCLTLVLGVSACSRGEPVKPGPSEAPVRAAAEPAPQPFAKDDKAAVRAALTSAGHDIGEDGCIAWPSSFPRVVVVGGFAHDRGCDVDGVFVDRTFHAAGGEVPGLATRDFEAALLAAKESIARAWIDEVVHAFGGHFVTESTTAFELDDSPKFSPVLARVNKIGGVVVEGWIAEPPGMQDASTFTLVTYRFAKDGALQAESKQTFTVDGQRIRAGETPTG
jgi:hypothetical protein